MVRAVPLGELTWHFVHGGVRLMMLDHGWFRLVRWKKCWMGASVAGSRSDSRRVMGAPRPWTSTASWANLDVPICSHQAVQGLRINTDRLAGSAAV